MSVNRVESLQTNITSDAEDDGYRRFVNLTQLEETGMDKTASMFDIAQMIAIARSGHSAHLYKKDACPAGVTDTGVNVRLVFESWPSALDFDYTLSSNIGVISPPTVLEEYTEFSIKFDKTNFVRLDFVLKSIESYEWETPCFASDGSTLPTQVLRLEDLSILHVDATIWGVVRIKGKKIGAMHELSHTLIKSYPDKPDEPLPEEGITAEDLGEYWGLTDVETWNGEPVNQDDTVNLTGYSVENLNITVTATWIGPDPVIGYDYAEDPEDLEDHEGIEEYNSLRLEIPQCVVDLLKNCDGDLDNFAGPGVGMCWPVDDQLNVYYSGCTGKVLDVRNKKDDQDSWCE